MGMHDSTRTPLQMPVVAPPPVPSAIWGTRTIRMPAITAAAPMYW
jgi:hypothetical protein